VKTSQASETGQISRTAAEMYEAFFVPALFQEWPARVLIAADVHSGQSVVDVGCGTGVLTRSVAERVGPTGRAVGLDLNPGMLDVAGRLAPGIDWRQGEAEQLPFEDDGFDAVVSQFALMFFRDREAAANEMLRVLRPGGLVAVAVWDRLEASPGYAAVADFLQRLFGTRVAEALRVPFRLGDPTAVTSLLVQAGADDVQVATHVGTARFDSIRSWIETDVRGWTLGDLLSEAQHERLLGAAERELRRFLDGDGRVTFEMAAHIVAGSKPLSARP
jgi:ubiquinone/menaquinone biosynthesis C-methylase UbiE